MDYELELEIVEDSTLIEDKQERFVINQLVLENLEQIALDIHSKSV